MKQCKYCPDPKPIKTDADFYPTHSTKCIECAKKHQKEYRARKKLERETNPQPEQTEPRERFCHQCPEPRPVLTDRDFYTPTGQQCKRCIRLKQKEYRQEITTLAKHAQIQAKQALDQRVSDLEEQLRLLNLLRTAENEARESSTRDCSKDSTPASSV